MLSDIYYDSYNFNANFMTRVCKFTGTDWSGPVFNIYIKHLIISYFYKFCMPPCIKLLKGDISQAIPVFLH